MAVELLVISPLPPLVDLHPSALPLLLPLFIPSPQAKILLVVSEMGGKKDAPKGKAKESSPYAGEWKKSKCTESTFNSWRRVCFNLKK